MVSDIVTTAISEGEKTKREEIKANQEIEIKKWSIKQMVESFGEAFLYS